MPLEINELKQRIHELKAITEQFSSGGTLAAKDVTGLVETILREVFHHAFPCLEETDQQIILKAIEKLDNNKVGVERFTFGHLNNLFNQTQFFEKYVKALQTRVEVVELINLTKFVQLRNKLIHKDAQLSKIEAKFLIQCLELFVDTFMTEETITKASIFYVPRSRNEYFTGREEILKELHHKLQQNQVVALNQKAPSVALHGLGGIGKTQTLIEYAYQCKDKNSYQTIVWMSADSQESFEASIRTLVFELALPIQEKTFEEIKKSVEDWFQQHRDWLLLIDNADDLNLIKDFLAKIKGSGQILISTRAQSTRPFAEPIEIEKMTDKEAFEFLEKRTGLSIDQHAKELVKLLDNLPLALDQAAAYICATQMSFEDYLENYQSYLEERGELLEENDHPDPITKTWQISFDKVQAKNEIAIEILKICAFLSPDGIIEEVFKNISKKDFNDALKEILKYSLLKRDSQRHLLLMHRLVQTVLREQLSQEEQHQIANETVKLIANCCPYSPDFGDFKTWLNRCYEWLFNARKIYQWIQHFNLKSQNIEILLGAIKEVLSDMNYILYKIEDYQTVLPLFEESIKFFKEISPLSLLDYTNFIEDLAFSYKSKREYDKALSLYKDSLKIKKEKLNAQYLDYAKCLHNLADLYQAMGEYKKALQLLEESLSIIEDELGIQHPHYALSLTHLSLLYYSMGNYKQALQAQQLFEKNWKIMSTQYPDYIINYRGLCSSMGIDEKILLLHEENMKITKEELGTQHSDYAKSLHDLALVCISMGKKMKALPLFEESLGIFTKVLGEQHPTTKTCKENYEKCLAISRGKMIEGWFENIEKFDSR